MVQLTYLSVIFLFLFCSCRNKTKEANTLNINNTVDSIIKTPTLSQTDSALIIVWAEFKKAVSLKDMDAFKKLSLDSILSCHNTYSQTEFINKCFNEVFDSTLLKKLVIAKNIELLNNDMELGYFTKNVLKKTDYTGDAITLKCFQLVKEETEDGEWLMTFEFIKTKQGYKFFSCDSYGGPQCCQ